MSRKGCSPDNAACEGFFGRLKVEMFYGCNWNHVSIDEFSSHQDKFAKRVPVKQEVKPLVAAWLGQTAH